MFYIRPYLELTGIFRHKHTKRNDSLDFFSRAIINFQVPLNDGLSIDHVTCYFPLKLKSFIY